MTFDNDKITSDELIDINVDGVSDTVVTLYKSGIKFSNKTSSDLLHAAGGTTTLKTINNNSLLGSGDINLPTINTPVEIRTSDDLNTILLQGDVNYYYTVGRQNPANSPTAGPYFSSLEKAGETVFIQTVKSAQPEGDAHVYIRGVYGISNESPAIGDWNEVAFITDIQDITGSNTYTGANYISKETNLTDAVIQLDEEIKATNDNLALEHANAEATYVKKAGDTMTGDLTVPNVVVTSGNEDGRKLSIANTGIDVIAPKGNTPYADSFLRVKDPTGENVIFNAFSIFSDSAVVGEGNQMAYVGGTYNAPTLSVFNTGLVGIGKSLGNPPTEKLDVNGNVKATKFIGPLQGNADTATKATQDASGNVITSTYATKSEVETQVDALIARIAALEAALTIQNV